MGAHTRGTLWREGKERGAGNWAGRYFRILYSSSCRMLLHPYTQAVWLSPGNTRNLTCRLWDIPQTLESCCVVRRRRKVDFLYGWRARNARHQPNNIDIPDILFRRERTQYNKKEQLFLQQQQQLLSCVRLSSPGLTAFQSSGRTRKNY